jgi:hypothetical protein
MSDASIIKEFLVGLGFKIDEAGFKKFSAGVKMATKVAAELGKGAVEAGLAVEAAVTKVSKQFEDLYYASQRINSSVENIRAMDYAITQMGGSAAGSRAAMENIAEFMRSNPGGERFIRSLGVDTREANGQLRDTADIMQELGARFRAMPYYAAKVRASMLGIDERTLQAMIRGTDEFSDRYRKMARSVGVDQQAAAKAGHEFMVDIRDLLALITLTGEKLILVFAPIAHVIIQALVALHGVTHGLSTDLLVLAGAAGAVWVPLKLLAHFFPELFEGFEGVSAAAEALVVVLSGPVGWILALVAAISAVLLSSKKFRDELGDLVTTGLQPLQDALGDVGKAFSEVAAAFQPVWDTLRPILAAIGAGLLRLRDAFVGTFGDQVLNGVRGAIQFLATDLHLLADGIRLILDLLTGRWAKAWADAGKTARDALAGAKAVWDALRGQKSTPVAPQASARGYALPPVPNGPGALQGVRSVGEQIVAYFQSHGFSRENAQGIAAGAFAETRLNPNAVNPTSGAFGIGQWLGARKAELFRRYGPHPTLAQQLEFMLWELTHSESRAGATIRRQDSARGALEAYVRSFMRPGEGTAGDLARGAQYLAAQENRPVLATVSTPPNVVLTQRTDVHVHGGADPAATGRQVANEQGRVNGDLLRNAKSALS